MESRYFLAAIVESSQDSIITIDFNLKITSWNKAAESLYGYTAEEAIGQQITTLTLPRDLQQLLKKVDDVRHSRVVKVFEAERVGKDGGHMILEVVVSPVKNDQGNVIGISTIARDLTEKRAVEKTAAEAELLRKVLIAQEDERARIARDIHDELGQQMTTLRFRLNAAKEKCKEEETCDSIAAIGLIAEEMDKTIDFLAWELRPALLKGIGLVPALDYFLTQWSNHSGVQVEPVFSGLQGVRFDEKAEANLYRIAQEALNNIHKHAKAKSAVVVLEKRGDSVVLIVTDDGKGFSVRNNGKKFKGVGLIGMKERASLLGGTLKIESTRGSGTTVCVTVPITDRQETGRAAKRAATTDSKTKAIGQRSGGP